MHRLGKLHCNAAVCVRMGTIQGEREREREGERERGRERERERETVICHSRFSMVCMWTRVLSMVLKL